MASTGEVWRLGHRSALDGVRGIAVLSVFLGHAGLPTFLGPAEQGAGTGVTLFFFLSGYLITTLLRLEHARTGGISLRGFYLRRARRILPAMYAALGGGCLLLIAVGVLNGGYTRLGLLAAGTQWVNYFQIFGGHEALPRGSGVFWSLAVEEHFYLLFPLLYLGLFALTRSRAVHAAVLAGLCAVILGWRVQLETAGVGALWLGTATDTRADSILLGCLLAVAANPAVDRPIVGEGAATKVLLPVGVLLLVVPPLAAPAFALTFGYTLQGFGALLLFVPVLGYPVAWPGRALSVRPLVFVGEVSYSLYLLHRLVQIPLEESVGLHGWVLAAVSLPPALGLAYASRRWVELPCIRGRSGGSVVGGRAPGRRQRVDEAVVPQ